jgi:5-(carboxyamino)imidazole ribonucleotide synthase
MMGDEAHALGLSLTVLATGIDESAATTCDEVVLGAAKDQTALDALSDLVDVVTFDHELIDLDQIESLENRGVVVRPSAAALRFAVDKAHQRHHFAEAGLPVPRFLVVDAIDDIRLIPFLDQLDGEPVVKTVTGGYDGRGVHFPESRQDTLKLIGDLAASGHVLIEERLELESEVAQVLARATDGSVALYPLVTTLQDDGMCVEVVYPAQVARHLVDEAAALAEQIASLIECVGILAIEFFVTAKGLIINEVALRPHNSGHWTIEGTSTSQFANHLRAVSGEELGDTTPLCANAVMVNVVGSDRPGSLIGASAVPGAHVHDYGKSWRPGRKLGHVTVVGDDATSVHVRAWESARVYGTRTREA